MSGHTPGPWRVIEREVLEDASVYPRHIVGAEELQVCLLESTWMADYLTQTPAPASLRTEANARLIAAAPDLLGVLQRILREGYEVQRNSLIDHDARAAITKATGEQP